MAREVTHRRRAAWPPASSYVNTADRPRLRRCARRSSCSRPARARRRGSCSTRSRRGIPTAWRTPAARSAGTSPTPPGSAVGGFIPKMLDTPAAQRGRRRRGCTSTCPGGSTTGSSISPAATTSRSAAGRNMPGYGFGGGMHDMPGHRRRIRHDAQEGLSPLLRRHRWISPAAARWCRTTTAIARSIRTWWTRGAFRRCASTGSGASRRCARRSTCRRPSATIIQRDGRRGVRADAGAEEDYGLEPGGRIIHEAGGTRMGKDPRTSVLNEWCQAHEAKNVFVCDAGPFVTNADKNCTWTIMALAWRTRSTSPTSMKKGNV